MSRRTSMILKLAKKKLQVHNIESNKDTCDSILEETGDLKEQSPEPSTLSAVHDVLAVSCRNVPISSLETEEKENTKPSSSSSLSPSSSFNLRKHTTVEKSCPKVEKSQPNPEEQVVVAELCVEAAKGGGITVDNCNILKDKLQDPSNSLENGFLQQNLSANQELIEDIILTENAVTDYNNKDECQEKGNTSLNKTQEGKQRIRSSSSSSSNSSCSSSSSEPFGSGKSENDSDFNVDSDQLSTSDSDIENDPTPLHAKNKIPEKSTSPPNNNEDDLPKKR
ncbi:uncharacterized protein LOC126745951 [Anthonomus grandis grandis]|uniref:uncharacterized protein LOC126745951 n=1 Tax=Anthonomus grandis grandis TaxID=2921223 RepID=UPI002165E7B9|nr:uncharacterized protein LOC126745951 [Anthonomus grandis grandis]